MDFRVTGLPVADFSALFQLPDAQLAARGVQRLMADSSPGYPDRITLDDAAVGESVLLLNYVHQAADTPFRASHAVYVRESATTTFDAVNEVPPALGRRLLALRAFDEAGYMVAADIVPGGQMAELVHSLFQVRRTAYLHAHYAKWGCYAARIDRVG